MKKSMQGKFSLILLAALFVIFLGFSEAHAATGVTFSVTYQQTSARAVADQVNQLRKAGSWYWNESNASKINTGKLSELTYDYELEKAAMTRAAEIALYYSHTRPDGSAWSTAYSGSVRAENIAVGYETASAAFNGWLEENENYAGQGHRRNMLKGDITAIGLGHVICNGVHYWVMELRSPAASGNSYTAPDNSTRSVTVQAISSSIGGIELSAPCYEQMTIGETYDMSPTLFLKGADAKNGWNRVPVSASFTVTIDDTTILGCTDLGGGTFRMTAKKAGTAKVEVRSSSSYGSPSVTFNVKVGQVNMDYVDISLSPKEYDWKGSPICPKPVLRFHGELLKEGTDYTLSYLRNDGCTRNNGGAIVSAFAVPGGRFSGFRSIGFEIKAGNIADQKITLSPSSFVYDGWTKEPEVIIPGLVKNKDFRVEYENNRMAGTASAIITGIGNFTGRTTVKFTIKSKTSATGSLKKPVIKSLVNKKGRKIKITWKKQSGVSGFQIRYQTGKKVKTVTVKKGSATMKTITKLKKGKTYTVKIRSYKKKGTGKTWSPWSKQKKIKIKK